MVCLHAGSKVYSRLRYKSLVITDLNKDTWPDIVTSNSAAWCPESAVSSGKLICLKISLIQKFLDL